MKWLDIFPMLALHLFYRRIEFFQLVQSRVAFAGQGASSHPTIKAGDFDLTALIQMVQQKTEIVFVGASRMSKQPKIFFFFVAQCME